MDRGRSSKFSDKVTAIPDKVVLKVMKFEVIEGKANSSLQDYIKSDGSIWEDLDFDMSCKACFLV